MAAVATPPAPTKTAPPPTPAPAHALGVELGDSVLWYDGGLYSSKPCVGLVIGLGMSGLQLRIFPPDLNGCVTKDGVRHMEDKKVRDDNSAGGWDFTARLKRSIDNGV